MRTFDIVMVLPETFFSMGSNIGVGRHGASHHFIARHGASLHLIARHGTVVALKTASLHFIARHEKP